MDTTTTAPELQEVHKQLVHVDHTHGLVGTRHFVLPVDDTDDSQEAIQWAVKNLYRNGDVYHLVNVIPEGKMVYSISGMYIPPNADDELFEIEDVKEFVKKRFAKILIEAHVPFALHVVVGSDSPGAIARYIRKKVEAAHADGVIIAKHHKGKLKQFFVGSVTKAVLDHVNVPVAIVPPLHS